VKKACHYRQCLLWDVDVKEEEERYGLGENAEVEVTASMQDLLQEIELVSIQP
jgi:hypothetical protein